LYVLKNKCFEHFFQKHCVFTYTLQNTSKFECMKMKSGIRYIENLKSICSYREHIKLIFWIDKFMKFKYSIPSNVRQMWCKVSVQWLRLNGFTPQLCTAITWEGPNKMQPWRIPDKIFANYSKKIHYVVLVLVLVIYCVGTSTLKSIPYGNLTDKCNTWLTLRVILYLYKDNSESSHSIAFLTNLLLRN
jgi:hypothetical protein